MIRTRTPSSNSIEKRKAVGKRLSVCDYDIDVQPMTNGPLLRGKHHWVKDVERSFVFLYLVLRILESIHVSFSVKAMFFSSTT